MSRVATSRSTCRISTRQSPSIRSCFATRAGQGPSGYANFAISEPPLKLVLIEGQGDPGSLNHLGVEVESTDLVARSYGSVCPRRAWPARPKTRWRVATRLQDKVWVDAPDGEPWEIYTVLSDVEMADGQLRTVEARGRGPTRMRCAARRHRSPRLGAAGDRPVPRPPGRRPKRSDLHSSVAIVVGSGIAAPRTLTERRRPSAPREFDRDGRRPHRADLAFGPVSGAHFNPVVTLADWLLGGITGVAGRGLCRRADRRCCAGAVVANLMFEGARRGEPPRRTPRASHGLWIGEFVATLGLILVIFGIVRVRSRLGRAVRGRRIHRGGLLVHVVDVVSQIPQSRSPACSATRLREYGRRRFRPFVAVQIVAALCAVRSRSTLHPDVDAVDVVVPHEHSHSNR